MEIQTFEAAEAPQPIREAVGAHQAREVYPGQSAGWTGQWRWWEQDGGQIRAPVPT